MRAARIWYFGLPQNMSLAYMTNLADLFAYGSNGTTPYTAPTANPVWAPLDSNLKIYFEIADEL